jgi:hypothetical protein
MGEPFVIAHGPAQGSVCDVASEWASQARTLAGRMDAAIYVGTGNTTLEQPLTAEQATRLGLHSNESAPLDAKINGR